MIFSSTDVRASDAERERMVEFLKAHYADGRLDEAEFSARTGAAYRAVYVSELDALARDLPSASRNLDARPRRSPAPSRAPLLAGVLVIVGVLAVAGSLPPEALIPLVVLTVPVLVVLALVVVPVALPLLAVALIARAVLRAPSRGREAWHRREER
jgi:hypothetical protein